MVLTVQTITVYLSVCQVPVDFIDLTFSPFISCSLLIFLYKIFSFVYFLDQFL